MDSPLSTLKLCFTLSSVRSRQSELNWEGRVGPDTFALCEVSQSVTDINNDLFKRAVAESAAEIATNIT